VVASLLDVGATMYAVAERSGVSADRPTTLGGTTRPPNKGMKLTKPSILELRSLSLVLGGPVAGPRNGHSAGVATDELPLPEQGSGCHWPGASSALVVPSELLALQGLGLSRLALQPGASFVHQRRYHC